MQCKQLVGPYAGQIIDMPFAVYQACKAAGTVVDVGEEHSVKGLGREPQAAPVEQKADPVAEDAPQITPEVKADDDDAGDPIEIPEDWMDQHHNWKIARAEDITGRDVKSKADAEKIIADYVAKK